MTRELNEIISNVLWLHERACGEVGWILREASKFQVSTQGKGATW